MAMDNFSRAKEADRKRNWMLFGIAWTSICAPLVVVMLIWATTYVRSIAETGIERDKQLITINGAIMQLSKAVENNKRDTDEAMREMRLKYESMNTMLTELSTAMRMQGIMPRTNVSSPNLHPDP